MFQVSMTALSNRVEWNGDIAKPNKKRENNETNSMFFVHAVSSLRVRYDNRWKGLT